MKLYRLLCFCIAFHVRWTFNLSLKLGKYFTPYIINYSVKPYFKNLLNSIELPLGSIFYTTQPFVKKLTTVKTLREKDLTKEHFFFRNSKLRNRMGSSKKQSKNRSSRPVVFYKKGVLRNFTKFTRRQLCQSPFFNKVAGLRPATLLKRRLWHRCFPVNFAKFLRTPFITEQLRSVKKESFLN